jgi:hypothetical protein
MTRPVYQSRRSIAADAPVLYIIVIEEFAPFIAIGYTVANKDYIMIAGRQNLKETKTLMKVSGK